MMKYAAFRLSCAMLTACAALGAGAQDTPSAKPAATLPPLPDLRENTFRDVMDQSIPMTPEEVRDFKRRTTDLQRAAAAPLTPLKALSGARSISFDPGSAPPEISLGTGRVTSIAFFDKSGTPWPVGAVKPGAAVVEITKGGDPNADSNIINVVPTVPQPYTDVSVVLKDAPAPIKISFLPGTGEYQSSLSLRVDAPGSNAKPPVVTGMPRESLAPETGNTILMAILNGVPPDGAQPLRVEGGPAQAWLINDQIYLRTALPVLSPAWNGSIRTGEMTAYQLDDTPIVLVSADGKVASLHIGLEPLHAQIDKALAPPGKPAAN